MQQESERKKLMLLVKQSYGRWCGTVSVFMGKMCRRSLPYLQLQAQQHQHWHDRRIFNKAKNDHDVKVVSAKNFLILL